MVEVDIFVAMWLWMLPWIVMPFVFVFGMMFGQWFRRWVVYEKPPDELVVSDGGQVQEDPVTTNGPIGGPQR